MIESFLEELPQGDEATAVNAILDDSAPSENLLLRVLPIIQKIVHRRFSSSDHANAPDLIQEVALRLWKWRSKYREKSEKMSSTEWDAFAARAAFNEVNRRPANRGKYVADASVDAVGICDPSLEGRTKAEVFSLIRQVWQQICQLSLRQRRALLLHSQELIIYFMLSGIADQALAATLDLSITEWNDIRSRLPLSDLQIAETMSEPVQRRKIKSSVRSIKKARYEARKKLEGLKQK